MDKLRLYMVTWNVATRQPEEDVEEMLGIDKMTDDLLPDLYAIGLQEVKSQPQNILMDAIFDDPWTNVFKDVLTKRDYIKVKTIRLQGILLSLFCLRKHLLHVRDMETQYTKTGLGGIWGNKGAVSIRLNIYGCSLCIVNCHLTPHDPYLQERVADYNTIIRKQVFKKRETSHILYHDYVFWIGDLNFRLEENPALTAEKIDSLVRKGDLKTLLQKDQLHQVMNSGDAFSELTETLPTFPPTYKFQFYSSDYDLKRRPSWTDRILYNVNENAYENMTLEVEQLSYNSFPQYIQSDHKPVKADFLVKVFSDHEDSFVTFEEIGVWCTSRDNSATYLVPSGVEPAFWDWIGVYKDGFTSLDDYICYSYAPRMTVAVRSDDGSQVKKITFPVCTLRTTGLHRLVYFGSNSGSILGMSQVFEIKSTDSSHLHNGFDNDET
ncbi:phosphatidylinositol 4,5-bisphosphate 5-phosphatase A-like [Schistocerca americana]|uniref:phosphatidylinositol 4,5-bisphosphate 5-phosphatase A-like n=1 Tax=Schistocerca americana TaxID=7009 RepID=UPI001F4FB693|nr:phosphatidylinositol 4,5-bisphosphate 5-phosphatase A-like [Schistocerca americana]